MFSNGVNRAEYEAITESAMFYGLKNVLSYPEFMAN